jgi:hypothetical protein
MPRIVCDVPAAGRPLQVYKQSALASFTTILDPPDFSIPDPSELLAERDPLDTTRAIVPGEIYITTPLLVHNRHSATQWFEVRVLAESGDQVRLGQFVIPAGETTEIPLQGRALIKRIAAGTSGDRLQVRAEVAGRQDFWLSAVERRASEHVVAP